MSKTRMIALLSLALSLAPTLAGCGAQGLPTATVKRLPVAQNITLSPNMGAVAVRFAGLPAYHTMATTQDIATVRLTLDSQRMIAVDPPVGADMAICRTLPAPVPTATPFAYAAAASASGTAAIAYPLCGYHQVIVLGAKDLHQATVNANFSSVPPGAVSLQVEALDAQGNVIGSGSSSNKVTAGKVTPMQLDVRLLPNQPLTGGVAASVTFLNSPMIM
ncbi:MAG TPA: hypothetical protein V6D47_16320 [Oscillatoriaceae cyanobacterium]